MTFVKVCGLSTFDDVEAARDAGADAVGFVWWRGSPRHVDLEDIAALTVGAEMETVLVTVGLQPDELLMAATAGGVSSVQPHGAYASQAAARAFEHGFRVVRPIAPGQATASIPLEQLLLVDTPDGGSPGGTGRTFDWSLVAGLERPFLLAGGLSPTNIAAAIRAAGPFGVDASSGLESAPGVKDHDLIAAFVHEAKAA